MPEYHSIGLMSGSSLDGLDMAYCRFEESGQNWNYEIRAAACVPYSQQWRERLGETTIQDSHSFYRTHVDLGHYFGRTVVEFMERHGLHNKVDFISSHGHTVFHFPEKQLTCQIGDGASISLETGIPVVCDFRSADIAAGGQGAPIVPAGDLHLFPAYKYLLNLGGIANLCFKGADQLIAFDICAANQVLNYLANLKGKPFDSEGKIAASGSIDRNLLDELALLEFYGKNFPKSLDNSFCREKVIPLLRASQSSVEDQLCTYSEHIALQITMALTKLKTDMEESAQEGGKMLVTGGGAQNHFLIERIRHHCHADVHVPEHKLVNYKEAMVMAFLGVLRVRNEINVLASVTGASQDTIGGVIHLP